MAMPAAESFELLYFEPPRERRVRFAEENIGMKDWYKMCGDGA